MLFYVTEEKFFLAGDTVAFFPVAVFPGQADVGGRIKQMRHRVSFFYSLIVAAQGSSSDGSCLPTEESTDLWRDGGYLPQMRPDDVDKYFFDGEEGEKFPFHGDKWWLLHRRYLLSMRIRCAAPVHFLPEEFRGKCPACYRYTQGACLICAPRLQDGRLSPQSSPAVPGVQDDGEDGLRVKDRKTLCHVGEDQGGEKEEEGEDGDHAEGWFVRI